MASVSTYLDTRRAKRNGEYPLKFNISINRGKKFLIHVNIDVLQEQWNGSEIVKHERKLLLNQYLRLRTTQIEDELTRLEITGLINTLPTEQIKERIQAVFSRTTAQPDTLADYWQKFIKQKDRKATIEGYNNTLIKIGTFADLGVLSFPMITPLWLRNFELHMKMQGLAVNSVFTHMRNLRAVFNDAINTDKIDQNAYPFRKYKIKSEKTPKRSLSIEELQTLMSFPVQQHQEKYRDLFMLIFCMVGINIVDLLDLRKINNGRVDFRRSKTGRLYSIKIEPEARLMINKYRGSKYLLDVLDNYQNYRDFSHRMNDNLQLIGDMKIIARSNGRPGKKEYAPLFPELTTYWARHTWATVAAGLDIPKETIAAALGHGGNSVTDIYIDFDRKKIDAANRRVISSIKIKRPLSSLKR